MSSKYHYHNPDHYSNPKPRERKSKPVDTSVVMLGEDDGETAVVGDATIDLLDDVKRVGSRNFGFWSHFTHFLARKLGSKPPLF